MENRKIKIGKWGNKLGTNDRSSCKLTGSLWRANSNQSYSEPLQGPSLFFESFVHITREITSTRIQEFGDLNIIV
jgi:hypothetical protein